jgi:hypothetical protein
MRTSILTAAILCGFAFGCSATSNPGAPDGGTPSTDGGTAPPATLLTCSGVFTCANPCAETDTACAEACLAKASPAGKEAVTGILTCIDTNSCTEATCFQEKCQKEMKACAASETPPTIPNEGPAPEGKVPADLAGNWSGLTDSFQFGADGRAVHFTKIAQPICSTEVMEEGTAVAEGTTVTIFYTQGTIKNCDAIEPYQPRKESFTFELSATSDPARPKLVLERVGCNDGAFLCRNAYDKR